LQQADCSETGRRQLSAPTIRCSYDATDACDKLVADTDFPKQPNAPTLRRDHELIEHIK
jgi:hypothetical protein